MRAGSPMWAASACQCLHQHRHTIITFTVSRTTHRAVCVVRSATHRTHRTKPGCQAAWHATPTTTTSPTLCDARRAALPSATINGKHINCGRDVPSISSGPYIPEYMVECRNSERSFPAFRFRARKNFTKVLVGRMMLFVAALKTTLCNCSWKR